MIDRLLIANRGEIACRIARSARRLGITSIAVYSDADRNARHVRECDEAWHLGPSPAAQSYLDIERLIATARRAGAQAVHPGYGFLSENARFAQACEQAGLVFVGPPASAILAMGSKSAAKAAMGSAGVPVAPGYHGEEQGLDRLLAEAGRVGFPLIVKASAGGGGKGMQVVESLDQARAAIESAQRLARTAFGDDRLLLERYFRNARHVEVQVFADASGEVLTLFDRDCSVQRRHQKVVEEAPAPGLREEVRAAMAEAARTVARRIGYVGAGTIEFLLDEAQDFYFMEMNTRLQVEHPVTEMITGIDLVEWQLRVARGEAISQFGTTPQRRGAAVEVRLYAEDPAQGYLPSVGRLEHLRWPASTNGVRVDAGVARGDEVSSYYDPMLGKIIAWAQSREEAIDRLRKAVDDFEVVGVQTNRALLASILATQAFRSARLGTRFLEDNAAAIQAAEPACTASDLALLALWCARSPDASRIGSPWDDRSGWRPGGPGISEWAFTEGLARVNAEGADRYRIEVGGNSCEVLLLEAADGELRVEMDGRRRTLHIVRQGAALHLFEPGRHVVAHRVLPEDSLESHAGEDEGSLVTPLPGTVVAVHVKVNDEVKRGTALVTVEAMKMEHTLTAPHDGRIARIAQSVGDRVAEGTVLVEMAAETRPPG
ncbi:MAG: biotin carboxylase N-terminal domain-containing protein [Steroidobacteraceae bacterium]